MLTISSVEPRLIREVKPFGTGQGGHVTAPTNLAKPGGKSVDREDEGYFIIPLRNQRSKLKAMKNMH